MYSSNEVPADPFFCDFSVFVMNNAPSTLVPQQLSESESCIEGEAVGRHRGLTQNTMINITVSHDYAKRNLPPAKKW
jgi:hypothetical protein